jgi:hypothetical protein
LHLGTLDKELGDLGPTQEGEISPQILQSYSEFGERQTFEPTQTFDAITFEERKMLERHIPATRKVAVEGWQVT